MQVLSSSIFLPEILVVYMFKSSAFVTQINPYTTFGDVFIKTEEKTTTADESRAKYRTHTSFVLGVLERDPDLKGLFISLTYNLWCK